MSQALASSSPRTGFRFMLTIQGGPEAGAAFQLLPPTVTIGRGPENNVVLNDSRVSRHAAVIEFSHDQILINDVSGRTSLAVNGEPVHKASIKDGDILQLGLTQMLFVVEALALAPPGQVRPLRTPVFDRPPLSTNSKIARGGRSKVPMYIVLVVVGSLVGLALLTNKVAQNKERQLKTSEEIEKDIKSSEDRSAQLIKKRTFRNDEERTRFEEAQKHYLEGFRDYEKGQWARAMKSFETASAIDPDHELARRYYKLSEKQRDEMTADLSLEGRRYKEKHMYTRCSSSLEKALISIPNKEDLKYKELEALKKECDLLKDSQYQ